MTKPQYTMFRTIITSHQLHPLPDVKLLDCRARLGDPQWGATTFATAHLPSAQRADLDTQLATTPGDRGRHPLPDIETWVAEIRNWGITQENQVVVYDDAGGAFAARAWWMFRWAGHAAVAVLDGGIQSWPGPLEASNEQIAHTAEPSNFEARAPLTKSVSAEDVLNGRGQIVDARSEDRWRGLEEPVDPVAGHIPGALCLPFQANLTSEGGFKSAAQLRARFAHLDDPIVCYCGSGVTAAHNVLALNIAGREEPSLYVGSWSEWINDPRRPIETC
jgi:thiosulfate/3-mercaptopyruvate sulfurtransferase